MNEAPRLLIVDDDSRACALLANSLQSLGYRTTTLMNGLHVEPEVRRCAPALVLLDVQLPGLDGLEVCTQLRRFSAVPIVMVSGRTDEMDRALGLEVGADDYVCKPFGVREIAARIKAHLRRADGRWSGVRSLAGFRLDDAGRRVGWRENWLPFTPQEFRVMRCFLSRPGHVLSREDLCSADGLDASERSIDSHVKNVRRKLQAVGADAGLIASVYGAGYRFEPPHESR